MKLRFYATASAHVAERHADGASMARPAEGGVFRFVGLEYDPSAPGHYRVSSKPYECDSDAAPQECAYLAKCCRDGDLIPADEATAKACGVPFKSASGAKPSGNAIGDKP